MADQDIEPVAESAAPKVVGVLAEFEHPGALVDAARAVREEGYRHFDTYSPFPIHGMDRAMGLGQSKLGYIVFFGGLAGASLGTWLQWWVGEIANPVNVSGKPFFAIWPSVPIIFELMVLFSAATAVAALLGLSALPRFYNPLFNVERFEAVTDDGFFLQIEASDEQFDEEETRSFLNSIGALNVDLVKEYE